MHQTSTPLSTAELNKFRSLPICLMTNFDKLFRALFACLPPFGEETYFPYPIIYCALKQVPKRLVLLYESFSLIADAYKLRRIIKLNFLPCKIT